MIRLSGVGYVYSARSPWAARALEGVDLEICDGEGVLVVGANGSGKSTLAWILAGLLVPTEGTAELDGEPIHRAESRVAISFQHARLQLFRPTVADDVAYGTDLDARDVDEALSSVGLDPDAVRDVRVDDLSGGQQRRVVLAGLIARHPRLLVLDEPFAGLDRDGRVILTDVLARLRRNGMALVVVSHDWEGAADFVGRVIGLDGGRVVVDEPMGQALADGELPAVLGGTV